MFCDKCGAQNPDDGNFCVKCGNYLSKLESNISKANENIKEEQVQKITLGFVISWIFGLLFGLAAIGGFLAGDYAPAFVILLISIIILPPFIKLFKEKFNFELSRGLKIAVVFVLILIAGSVVPDTTDQTTIKPSDDSQQTPVETEQKSTPVGSKTVTKEIASTSFSDFGDLYCNPSATNLQKETFFNENFKGKYVKWTGTVSSVSETWGKYRLRVKHCPATWFSDVTITMREDQKDKLLQLNKGDSVTYIAKMNQYGEILDISAVDGKIV